MLTCAYVETMSISNTPETDGDGLYRLPTRCVERGPTMPNPYHDEVLSLLRRADCHYGWALRDEEEGLTVEEAANKRDQVRTDRIVELRKAVHMVAKGEHSINKKQAGHEDGVLRALLHFRGVMSDGLRQHVTARLSQLQPQFCLTKTQAPLQCRTRGANARRY